MRRLFRLIGGARADYNIALHDMGDESLVGIVDLMTGEKDPRNLMLAFSILKVVMVEWDIKNHIEVLFPVLFKNTAR